MKNLLFCGVIVACLVVQGCSQDEPELEAGTPPGLSSLTGSVLHDPRHPAPSGAMIHVELQDISTEEGTIVVLASTQTSARSASPYEFELLFDPRLIRSDHEYIVSADLRTGTDVLDDSPGSVEAFGEAPVSLAFKSQPAVTVKRTVMRTLSLQGIRWQLAELDGEAIAQEETSRLPYLEVADDAATFAGFSGCNNYTGSYRLEGTSVSFENAISTRKHCEGLMDLETRYLAMLANVATWRMEDQKLVVGDSERSALARFVTAN
jgi:putative lipoprotein